ncbi:MAG TPA: hypothetical protein VFU05_07310 [Cyclobacteriaceae bacterium]|nr:hypothetical protein [Cyclobacteriaceae bacterium]
MKKFHYSILIVMMLCLTIALVHAQDKTEKSTISLTLTYHQLNDELPLIKVSAKTKKERKFEPVEGVEINLFFGDENSSGFLGRVKTNMHGAASLTLPTRLKAQWDSLSSFKFIGTVTQNDLFEDQSTELEISKAKIELSLDEADSIRTIHAKVLAFQDTSWVAQSETEVKLVVRRLLSDLAATEEETFTTDENGEVSAEYTLNLPGDTKGDIIIGAKIDDHEVYGSLVAAKSAKWGIPLVKDNSFSKRTLWATRDKTPLWLLIFPNLIIAGVWGIIFYLVYQLTRIVKLGKASPR